MIYRETMENKRIYIDGTPKEIHEFLYLQAKGIFLEERKKAPVEVVEPKGTVTVDKEGSVVSYSSKKEVAEVQSPSQEEQNEVDEKEEEERVEDEAPQADLVADAKNAAKKIQEKQEAEASQQKFQYGHLRDLFVPANGQSEKTYRSSPHNKDAQRFQDPEVVQYMYNSRAHGDTFSIIASNLNKKEIPTKRGNEWVPSTVQKLIQSRFYLDSGLVSQELFYRANRVRNRS